jgi:hypothetical protein
MVKLSHLMHKVQEFYNNRPGRSCENIYVAAVEGLRKKGKTE